MGKVDCLIKFNLEISSDMILDLNCEISGIFALNNHIFIQILTDLSFRKYNSLDAIHSNLDRSGAPYLAERNV